MTEVENIEFPLAYLITFTCYGFRLHGDEKGSVDRNHNYPDTPMIDSCSTFEQFNKDEMKQPPYLLDPERRRIVMKAIKEVCDYRGWILDAAHVLSGHVHVVVRAPAKPEKIMRDFKAYASRHLNEAGFDYKGRKRWSRHGSTRYKWEVDDVCAAVEYVVRGQDGIMEIYERK